MPIAHGPVFHVLDSLSSFFHYERIISQNGVGTKEATRLGKTSIQGLTPFFTARSSIASASCLLPLKGASVDREGIEVDISNLHSAPPQERTIRSKI